MTRYDTSVVPPAPILKVNVSNPDNPTVSGISDAQALIDSGAFMSAIPNEWVNRLRLLPFGDQDTHGYKEGLQKHLTYFVEVAFNGLSFCVEVLAVNRKNMLLGRDVLNRLKLMLDGKNLNFDILDP